MRSFFGKITCADLGHKCTMENRLMCERIPEYRYVTRPAGGVDARPGDTVQVRVGDPIGYKRRYSAYRECSHCHRREDIGSKTVNFNTELTFNDFLTAQEKEAAFNEALAKFDAAQRAAREKFIRENKPKF